mgnify:CR=1 FL=1
MKHLEHFFYILALTMMLTACGGDDDNENTGGGSNGGNSSSQVDSKNLNANKNVGTVISNSSQVAAVIQRMEFPQVKAGERIIVNKTSGDSQWNPTGINYCVRWDDQLKSQRYSCYPMCESMKTQNTSRYYDKSDQYPYDTRIPESCQFSYDPFWGSGYDHGHICPSADRLYSYDANKQTFYLSNMMPQVNGFNAKVWANMEQKVRDWSKKSSCDTLYVCKGGTIEPTTMCQDAVMLTRAGGWIIPKYFFMAMLKKKGDSYSALGFWIEHKANDTDQLAQYVVNIDELEEKTGLDFFCNLPDNVEVQVESMPRENIIRAWGVK